jgi:signal transduction histidine kinase
VERVVTAARVALATFSFAAIWLDPSTPASFQEETYALLGLYLGYAVLVLGITWTARVIPRRLGLVTHVIDLGVFSVVMSLTDGPTSPFFVYFVFAVLVATLRWQWRGTVWTALAAIITFVAMSAYMNRQLPTSDFELNRFIIRSVYLAVVAWLVGYAGYFQQRMEAEMARVAAWPRHVSDELESLIAEMLPEAGAILRAPHVVLVWEETEEPWVYVASWRHGRFQYARHPPGAYTEIVGERLAHRSFMCADLKEDPHQVIVAAPGGPTEWRGLAVNPVVRDALELRAVLCWPLRGETFDGRLFAAGKADMIADDLVLGEIVATLVSSRMDHTRLLERLRRATATEERLRFGRDLHDGLLQTLAGVALQLRSVADTIPDDAAAARIRLGELQTVLESEQRELRSFIRELRLSAESALQPAFDLRQRLSDLCVRVEHVWPVRVGLRLDGTPSAETFPALDLYRVIHEALVNAARHSGASTVEVLLSCRDGSVAVRVTDDGRGFPFIGTYELTALNALRQGPATLKERVARLGGSLRIESTTAGSRLDIAIPTTRAS